MLASEVDAAAGLCPSDLMDVSSSLVPTSARAGLVEGSVLVALADVAVGEELASLSFSLSLAFAVVAEEAQAFALLLRASLDALGDGLHTLLGVFLGAARFFTTVVGARKRAFWGTAEGGPTGMGPELSGIGALTR